MKKQPTSPASDGASCCAYLDDTVTVGELIRWLNEQVVKAAKTLDYAKAHETALFAVDVESAWACYLRANPIRTNHDHTKR